MCFYLYSREGSLSVDFSYEDIKIYKRGYSEITLDLLVGNKEKPIDVIYILYPNLFAKDINFKAKTIRIGNLFENRTEELLEPKGPANYHYSESFGRKLYPSPNEPDLIILEEPDPVKIDKAIKHEGYVLRNDQIDFREFQFPFDEENIMCEWGYTLFRIEFNKPLQPNKCYWLRLFFKPPSTTLFKLGWIKKNSIFQFMYKISLHYTIFSPLKVLQNFKNLLQTYGDILRNSPILAGTSGISNAFRQDAIGLIEWLQESVAFNETRYNDMRLVLNFMDSEPNYFVIEGGIIPQHPFPNLIEKELKKEARIKSLYKYFFLSGNRYKSNDAKFTLTISSKSVSYFEYLIPIIIILLIIGFICFV